MPPCHPYPSAAFSEALTQLQDPPLAEVISLAAELCAIPGVSVPASATDFSLLTQAVDVAAAFATAHGLRVTRMPVSAEAPYPFLIVSFAEHPLEAPETRELIALIGHLDVVPQTQEGQFHPCLRGDDLVARGAADMKTVVASFLGWMSAQQAQTGPKPPIALLLATCEENGSHAPNHMSSVLEWLERERGVQVRFGLVGERTGELEWMPEEISVGPICRENRSWRWVRAQAPDDEGGMISLHRVAAAVRQGRRTVLKLNEGRASGERDAQPGVRSGLVNPFCFVPGDERPRARSASEDDARLWLRVNRVPGPSVHSATASVAQGTLVERFEGIANRALAHFGAERLRLLGVEIGQADNYNSYDGSGELRLEIGGRAEATETEIDGAETLRAEVAAFIDDLKLPQDLRAEQSTSPLKQTGGTSLLGLDIRELLEHRERIEDLLQELPELLWGREGFERVLDAPPWRCPDDHPDLALLLTAWREVMGRPSPDLVKLHGNDGGNLVAHHHQQSAAPRARDAGPAVVFGQVGAFPHGAGEFHRVSSIRPYWRVLDRWARDLSEREQKQKR